MQVYDIKLDMQERKIIVDNIKLLGEHTVKIKLDEGVIANLLVKVIAE